MSFKKIIYAFLVFAFIFFVFYMITIFTRTSDAVVVKQTPVTQQTVFEAVELKSQKDFKLIGQILLSGSGYEPGFNFTISLAGTKFGVDLTSQYGDTRYVGYLDLNSQSTTTKIFSGNMLDKNNKVVTGEFTISKTKCFKASGDEVPYSVSIKVAKENLKGCADMAK